MNITIPEDLHERLQSVKDSVGNVSAVCQSAIEKTVSLEEAKMNAVSKREKAVVRLKAEREQASDDCFQSGKKSGLESSETLEYVDLKKLENLHTQEFQGQDLVDSLQEDGGYEWLFEEIEEAGYLEDLVLRYVEGWLEGVMEFWKDIQDEVER